MGMKYFNHMTSSAEDEKHEILIDKAGLAGYGAYWIVLEKVASQIRRESISTSLALSWRNWARYLRSSTKKSQFLLKSAQEAGLLQLTEEGSMVRVDIPNLLKYADEYTRKLRTNSRLTPDKLPTESGSPAVEPAVKIFLEDQNLKLSSSDDDHPPSKFSPNKFSPKDMMRLWNEGIEFYSKDREVLIPKIQKLTDERKKKALSRIKDCQIDEARWRSVINAVHQSAFLSGKSPSKDHVDWSANFDFVIRSQTVLMKILEGGYR